MILNPALRFMFPLLLAFMPFAAPAADLEAGVRVTLTGPGTPYAEVVHEVGRRHGTVVVSVRKTFAAGFGHRDEVGLLTDDDLEALLDGLVALGAFELASSPRKDHRARHRVEIAWKGRHHVFEVDDPELQADERYGRLITRVRAAVGHAAGVVPFQDAMLLPEEAGRLNIVADPPARARIDGVVIEGTTPLGGLRLPAGSHRVELTPVGGGPARTYDVKIEVGKTTNLTVNLR